MEVPCSRYILILLKNVDRYALQFCYTINLIFKEEIMFNFMKKAESATTEAQASTTQSTFKDIRPQWKTLAQERKITKEDIAALCIYRSLIKGEGKEGAISRLKKAFKPVTNPVKIENGAYPFGSLQSALWSIKYSNIMDWLDEPQKVAIIAIAKDIKISGGELS